MGRIAIFVLTAIFATVGLASELVVVKTNTEMKSPSLIKLVTEETESLLPDFDYDEDDYGYSTELINKPLKPMIVEVTRQVGGQAIQLAVEVYVEFARVRDGKETGEEYGNGTCDITLVRDQNNQWQAGGHCDNAEWDQDYDY